MNFSSSNPFRFSTIFLIGLLSISGCSSSGDAESTAESVTPDANENNVSAIGDPTRVTFEITVPVYVSNELQVKLIWGDVNTSAMWVSDESWTIVKELPKNTENTLMVTFNDRNGAIILGSFEAEFKTGRNPTELYQINANQFDTNLWDSDDDGISNISELTAGTNTIRQSRVLSRIGKFRWVKRLFYSQ